MKKLTKLAALLLAVATFVLLPDTTALTASAEGPTTYYVKQVANESDWRYQTGSSVWDDNAAHRELYYLHQNIKDGDIVIVDGAVPSILKFSVRLGNLTVQPNSTAVIYANAIDECYVLHDTTAAVNGNITNAYVYDNAVCTFNNNVGTLNIMTDPSKNESLLFGSVTVAGTVDRLIGNDGKKVHYDLYSFAAGKLVVDKGTVKTDASQYSTTPSATNNSQSNTPSSSDEYDDVPKTGDSNLAFLLLGISAICFAGRYGLKKAQ